METGNTRTLIVENATEQAVELLKKLIATPSVSRDEEAATDIIEQYLQNAGCTIIDQHYASSTSTWNGWNYYYCLHNGESDWIGPVNDTDFYECWIYLFMPNGSGIYFR